MADEGRIETDARLSALERKIRREYAQAEKEVREKAAEYFESFKKKDHEMRLRVLTGKITEKDWLDWRRNQMIMGKRWDDLADSLAHDFADANKKASAMINHEKPDIYAINYNYGTYEAESGSSIDTGYIMVDRSTIERLMLDDPDMLPPVGKKVAQEIAEGKAVLWNRQLIQSVATQGILQGESLSKLAVRLAVSVGDSNMASAMRNARTMFTGAQNAGRVDSYKRAQKMGIKMRQTWMATLDGRTRDSHIDMDGETVDVGKKFSNGCYFPADPHGKASEVYNCRCTLVAQVEGFEIDIVNERELDSYDENLKGMSYSEWKRTHAGRDQRRKNGRKR